MALEFVTGHTIFIYDRGGLTRLSEVKQVHLVRWNRIRDDISAAQVDLNGALGSLQAALLGSIEPARHEMVIFRGTKRVWEGPITRVKYTRAGVEIHALDVCHYVHDTIMKSGYSSAFPNIEYATARIKRIMLAELARKESQDPPINVAPYIVEHHLDTNAKTALVTKPYKYTVWEHLDGMAQRNGIDYTVIGRAIHLWDTSTALGMTAVVTEADFLGDIAVTVHGIETATLTAVTDGEGRFAETGGEDPYYGIIERLSTMDDEDDDTAPPSQEEMLAQAVRNHAGRTPTPVSLHIPDNSSLNPKGILTVDDLVPGVFVPVRVTLTARTVSQMQKLQSVKFEETPEGETISVVFYPSTTPDEAEEEV